MRDSKLSIFSKSRIKFQELYDDALAHLKTVYNEVGEYFSNSSPFGQLLRVTLHLGRLVLSYVEDSITELNITTATRGRSIRGLATLTGHNPSRGMGARGAIKLLYNNSGEYENQTVSIINYTTLLNKNNGLKYVMILPSDNIKMLLANNTSYSNISIAQGEIKYLQGTGDGSELQSINFNVNNNLGGIIDNFFVNVYVNGERWRNVNSILDMTYQEKACIIKTSQNSGVDVFFGNGNNGAIPPLGSTILFEYLFSQGVDGNINNIYATGNNWQIETPGYLESGESIDLNSVINVECSTELLFGCNGESLEMTKLLAPNASRSFVLANKNNYEYFLRKLNMFSVIDIIQGFGTDDDIKYERDYKNAVINYDEALKNYKLQSNLTGINSDRAKKAYETLKYAKERVYNTKRTYENSRLDDNTMYLFLIPDISQRINDTDNYFTCNPDIFLLTDNEKSGILDLIKSSGQQMLTVDNEILNPLCPKFAINCFIQIWEEYNFDSIRVEIIDNVSTYLINNTRRDRIPVSDIISIIENIQGVDSVTVIFDADNRNKTIYNDGTVGIDTFGDIILERTITNIYGEKNKINDILPVFRGNWFNSNGTYYSDDINGIDMGPINISLRGTTYRKNRK